MESKENSIVVLKKKHEEIEAIVKQIREGAETELLSHLADYVGTLGLSDKVTAFRLTGTTPSWNDGDPCYHSQSIYVRSEGTDPEDEEWDEEGLGEYKSADYEIGEHIRQLSILEMVFGTGWEIIFRKGEDGKWSCKKDHYDCDY